MFTQKMILKNSLYSIAHVVRSVRAGLVRFFLIFSLIPAQVSGQASGQTSGQSSGQPPLHAKIAILFSGNFQERYPSYFEWEKSIEKIISPSQQKLLATPQNLDSDLEPLINLFILRSLCLFYLLKKLKIPFDLVVAQSMGHIPALYAIKAMTLPEMKKIAHRLAKAVAKAFDQIHDQFGQIDTLTSTEPIFQKIQGVFLIHQISASTSVYAGTKKTLQLLVQHFSSNPQKILKYSDNCIPIASPFFFSSLPYIHQIFQKAHYRSPKRILLSDVTGKILGHENDLRLALYQLWTHPRQTFKMCKTLKKQGITHVIILGKDQETEKALKENLPHIKVISVQQASDLQALAKKGLASP